MSDDIDREQIEKWLDAINTDAVNLTAWEIDFVESMTDRLGNGYSFSERQAEIIERIFSQRTP